MNAPIEERDGRRARLSRRRVLQGLTAVGALPALGSLAACGGSAAGDDTLTFVYMGDANQQKQFAELFAEFNKRHPEIKLEAQGIPANNWAKFANTVATRIAGGQAPDLIQIATEGQRIFASKGLLHPLERYIEADQDVVDEYFADIDPNLAEWNTKYASHDGRTYYMPGGFNTMCIHANVAVFDKAGVELPADGAWSWDDFRAAGEKIKSKTGAYLIPGGFGYFADIMPWLTTNGASTFDAAWEETTYDSQAAVEALRFVKGLVDDGLAIKPGGQFDAFAQMKKGRLATVGGGRWPVIELRRLGLVEQVTILPWPAKEGPGSPVGWDAWGMTESSQKKEQAWTFIKFCMSKEASEFFADIGGTIVPARRSVANSPAFLENAPAHSERLFEAVSYATPIPSPAQGAQSQKIIEEAWKKVLTGNGEPEATLREADRQLTELL